MQDQQIMDMMRAGRRDKALTALYHHFPMVRKLIRSHGGNTEDAEDIFQESLIILCRKLSDPGFTLSAKISSYLYSVSRFLWMDEMKKRKPALVHTLTGELPETEQKELEETLHFEEKARLAEKILNETGERCRELLLLFYHAGLKLKDIASRMGYSSEGAAKNQKYKCLEGIKNRLKEMEKINQTV